MTNGYEINDMAKEESWRMFRIMEKWSRALISFPVSNRQ